MSVAIEALGMSLPGDASTPAIDPRKVDEARRAGQTLLRLLEEDVRPRDILTKQAFENAITAAVSHMVPCFIAANRPTGTPTPTQIIRAAILSWAETHIFFLSSSPTVRPRYLKLSPKSP